MVGASTRRALGRRAIGTAHWMERWVKRLQDEMKKQSVELSTQRQNMRDLTGDNNLPFTLRRRDVRELVQGMQERIAEIRRFSDSN